MVLSSAESLPIQALQLMQKERENSDDYEESYHTIPLRHVYLRAIRGEGEMHHCQMQLLQNHPPK
jgi:hypothetical protein